jgi:hypothetical protein
MFQLHDLAQDLAVARASANAPLEPDEVEAFEGRTFRRRIAGLVWFPAAVGVLFLAGWANSLVLGIAGFAVLVFALWLYAERGDRVAARIRKGRG